MSNVNNKIFERIACEIDLLKYHSQKESYSLSKFQKEFKSIDSEICFFASYDVLVLADADILYERLRNLLNEYLSSQFV
ncbi:MAG: hypothetical protein J6K43_12125 [Lachnospiraceae bacterium]|nr:hypothetical protein [Lachnospiraceae bacterium]